MTYNVFSGTLNPTESVNHKPVERDAERLCIRCDVPEASTTMLFVWLVNF